ncbi:MAG: cupin domain-containing protein [Bacteroidetes bacterium]|nr:cupin domain-containing protein [Bacteroidota bacterium]
MLNNIFENIAAASENERIEVILNDENIVIERIISYGNPTPEGYWYNQDKNEWVLLLSGEAKLEFKDKKTINLKAGDYLMINAHQEHRVVYTSKEPNCIWLAFHFK